MKNKNLNIRINEELLNKAKAKAKNETRPLSNYITYLIKEDLKKERMIKMEKLNEKELNACKKLVEKLFGGENEIDIEENLKNDYLSICTGRDKKNYVWYCDENKNGAINIDTLEFIDDEDKLEKLFY